MEKKTLIGINGKISSGKDTVGKIIQYLTNPFDRDMKTYLKTSEEEFYTSHIAFDKINLTRIDVSKGLIEFNDDIEDIEDTIQYYIREGLIPCTREEFNEVLIRETKRLNEITKEL